MKADILSLDGKKKGSIDLPSQFSEPIRKDLIKRAVLAIQSNKRQAYGATPKAGQRHSAELSRRRRKYRGSYGKGISRIPRKIMSRQGLHFNWTGAIIPGTVGGRRAHPPKATRIWNEKLNTKERRKAIRSAIAATTVKELVEKRGHKFVQVPFIIESALEKISKTKDAKKTLETLGLKEELTRSAIKKVRAGIGKMRGRKYKKRKGPLIVVSEKCSFQSAAENLPGVDIMEVKSLNAELLAPGCEPGRLTLWTDKAIEKLAKEKLFTDVKQVTAKKETEEKLKKVVKKKAAKKKVVKK